MITGANSGIGFATSLGLARQGLEIVMVCRSRERGEAAQKEIILRTGNSFVHLMMADLSSQKSIRDFAAEFKSKFNSLHILINNAGISPFKRELSVDGIEMAFATNHLGPFLLTNLLLDVLKSSAPARIINIASIAHRGAKIKINFDDLQGEVNYDGSIAYGQSKLANILFTYELARRLEGTGVTVNALCPGGVATNIWRQLNPPLQWLMKIVLKSPEEAARLPIYLATSKDLDGVSGKYFEFKRHLRVSTYIPFLRFDVRKAETMSSAQSYDEAVAKRLWETSAKFN